MSNGSDIAADVLAGLIEAGEATGQGRLFCTIKRPATGPTEAQTPREAESIAPGAVTFFQVTAVQEMRRVQDQSGTLTSETMTMLLVDATGTAPIKSDLIAVGVAMADADTDTVYYEVAEVAPLSPGGVPVMYEVQLAD